MPRLRFISLLSFLMLLPLGSIAQAIEAPQPATIAIARLGYLDTSGDPGDARSRHAALVHAFTDDLGRDLTAAGYRVMPLVCGAAACDSSADPETLVKAARTSHIRFVLLGGFHKMSTLVQWAKLQMLDADQGRIVFDRLVTFRNDTPEAWVKAEDFLMQEIKAAKIGVAASADPPIKLAVFPFELLDFSGGGGLVPEDDRDRADLYEATVDVRKLLSGSGRYSIVDTDNVDAPEAKAHELNKCNGCDAAIAKKLGADQSMVGIVTRITRTDYAVTYKIRNAQTGALVDVEQSDLRIGANYSWPIGAVALVKGRLLDRQAKH